MKNKEEKKYVVVINVSREGYVSLTDFSRFLDTSKVCYYSVKVNKKKGTMVIRFYDNQRKLVKPYKIEE